jgi:hypothetical protein
LNRSTTTLPRTIDQARRLKSTDNSGNSCNIAVSGSTRPSKANQAAFDQAVEEVTRAVHRLFAGMTTSAAPKDRDSEARKARERAARRYGAQSLRPSENTA